MSALVWVMADGEHQDMVAMTCTSDGKWLAIRWDWREAMDMFGTGHDSRAGAEEAVMDWTGIMEAVGAKIIAGPLQLDLPIVDGSGANAVMMWWDEHLRPAVVDMVLDDPADLQFDDDCTMRLPPAIDPRVIMCGPPPLKKLPGGGVLTKDPYMAKLSWGP